MWQSCDTATGNFGKVGRSYINLGRGREGG